VVGSQTGHSICGVGATETEDFDRDIGERDTGDEEEGGEGKGDERLGRDRDEGLREGEDTTEGEGDTTEGEDTEGTLGEEGLELLEERQHPQASSCCLVATILTICLLRYTYPKRRVTISQRKPTRIDHIEESPHY